MYHLQQNEDYSEVLQCCASNSQVMFFQVQKSLATDSHCTLYIHTLPNGGSRVHPGMSGNCQKLWRIAGDQQPRNLVSHEKPILTVKQKPRTNEGSDLFSSSQFDKKSRLIVYREASALLLSFLSCVINPMRFTPLQQSTFLPSLKAQSHCAQANHPLRSSQTPFGFRVRLSVQYLCLEWPNMMRVTFQQSFLTMYSSNKNHIIIYIMNKHSVSIFCIKY